MFFIASSSFALGADLVIHTGHESCEEDVLWLSRPTGWTEVAMRGGCE